MAGFNFGFFGDQEHKVFNYKPRYYDPEAEERKAKFAAVDGTMDKSKDGEGAAVPGSHLRGAFRGGNYSRRRTSGGRVQIIIGFVTLLLIAVVLIYITKFYSLL
ncbi:MAG: hypothetical protein J6T02_00180 [Bacteroidales bacterium]|nr:hypothetical protein [Bacteroidales bacterium]